MACFNLFRVNYSSIRFEEFRAFNLCIKLRENIFNSDSQHQCTFCNMLFYKNFVLMNK